MNDLAHGGLLLTLAAAPLTVAPVAMAATFGQKEVSQSQFVVVAVPRQDDYYSLLLIEQLSSSKKCWQESGSSPTVIDPLLLKFDFSGICGRSTDSNGYSIRQQGQDMALKYRLSVQKRNNEVVLLGVPSGGQGGGSVEIGRTQGIEPGFLKIQINPGWRLTKRTYQGKTLGHIYLTTDKPFESLPIASSRSSSQSSKRLNISKSSSKPSSQSVPIPPPVDSRRATRKDDQDSTSRWSTRKEDRTSTSSSDTVYRVMVKTRDSREQDQVRRLVSDSFRSSYGGRTVMQVGLFDDKKTAVEMKRRMAQDGLDALYVTEKKAPRPVFSSTAVSRARVLPVPSSRAPLGNASGNRRVLATLPPPPPSALLGPRYRVVVASSSSKKQTKLMKLVPDAFRSSYQGRSVLQVGSFKSQGEADDRIRFLERKGFDPIIEKTQ
ncbi:MAG: DUF3747 domain-containing protein [Thermosynechococcaceae cyanobacterium]